MASGASRHNKVIAGIDRAQMLRWTDRFSCRKRMVAQMEEYEIIPDPNQPSSIAIKWRAASVIAVAQRATRLLPPEYGFEIRADGRCVYRKPAHSAHAWV